MSLDPFRDMHNALFAAIGESALLRGSVPCSVSVEHGTAVTGEYGNTVGYRTQVEIYYDQAERPRKGDALVLIETNQAFRLDEPLEDDGYSAKFLVLAV